MVPFMSDRVAKLVWVASAACAAVPTLSGCNIVAPVQYALVGQGEVKKEFELDKNSPTVLFVDDPANRVAQRRVRATIGDTAQRILLEKRLINAGNMIDTRAAMAMAGRGTASEPVSIREIGEAVGADLVVYALVSEFDQSPLTDPPRPTALLHVKIIDVETGDRVWPPAAAGYPLRLTMPADASIASRERTDVLDMEESLAAYAGAGLAQLFYDVEVPFSLRTP